MGLGACCHSALLGLVAVALGRMGGERAAGRVSPPELRGSWKAPARRAGLRMLDVQKGKTQGNREISKMG